MERRDPREVHVGRVGMDDVAEHDVSDGLQLDAGALHGRAGHGAGQLGSGTSLSPAPNRPMPVRTALSTTTSPVMLTPQLPTIVSII